MVGKIWRAIKKGVTHFHYDERGDPATFLGIATFLGPAAGAALGPGTPESPQAYMSDPGYQARSQFWAKGYGEEYPDFPGLPEQAGQMGTRLTEMLSGELSPAVKQYLGYKYNQAWQSGLPHLADIGAGPGTLASVQQQQGQQQAIQGAYMGQEQIARGMQYMPQYTQMMLSPYMADVQKWGDVGNVLQQNYPGAQQGEWWRNLKPGEYSY